MKAHYETLGVAEDATQEQITKAYRRKAKAAHTDREGGDNDLMAAINVAYEVLSDPERRKNYDATGQDRVNQLYKEAESIVLQKAMQWMQSASEETNMVAVLLEQFASDRKMIEQNQQKGEKVLNKLNKILKKLRYNGKGDDKIRAAIQDQRDGIQKQMDSFPKDFQRIDIACDIVRSYSYEITPVYTTTTYAFRPMLAGGGFVRFP
jgi:curved DNA-binding protein CbpA